MVVKKFYGKTTRDALRQVREELGADALILSNRPTIGGGVEIMAVADADVATLATSLSTTTRHPPRNAPATPASPVAPGPTSNLNGNAPPQSIPQPGSPRAATPPMNGTAPSGAAVNRALARTYAMPVEPLSGPAVPPPQQPPSSTPTTPPPRRPSAPPPLVDEAADYEVELRPRPASPPPQQPQRPAGPASSLPPHAESLRSHNAAPDPEMARQREIAVEELRQIGDEIKQLRSLLQGQLASFAWADMEHRAPNRLELFRYLLASGLSAALIRQLIDKMPAQYNGELALKWARSALMHNLKCAEADRELLDQGGIYAVVGPTGVGKTTTVAKLAARATMRFGAQHVALITTDSYRIGAQDQLRIYGKILSVPVYAVQNEAELQLTLADLADRHLVFIDTVGMGQRDARVAQQAAMFSHAGRPVERLLLIAANADGHTLEDVVRQYRGEGLTGCLLSKIDEAIALAPALDAIIRNRMRLFYVTNGQRVPEDLHLASASFLIDRALKAPQQPGSPFTLQGDELPIMNAAQAGWL
jgi:flagellar biosynthesis protein FlhF